MLTSVVQVLLLASTAAQAYLLPTSVILDKTAAHHGKGTYAIEQEVEIQLGSEAIQLKETWLVDNERLMRLTVTGANENKTPIRMQFIYNGGQRTHLNQNQKQTQKVADDFLEKYFHVRNQENLLNYLVNAKIIPSTSALKRSPVRSGNDYKYEAESFLRLSRTGGVVAYALGEPTPADQDSLTPGIWIEQDQFVIRKLRLPSQAEVTGENYAEFTRGLHFPRLRQVRWEDRSATIRVINVAARSGNNASFFQTSSLDQPNRLDGLEGHPTKNAVLEFYTRFR